MTRFEAIDSVVFDWGGVLVGLRQERCVKAFGRLGCTGAARMLSSYGPTDLFNRLEIGSADPSELCEYVRRTGAEHAGDEEIFEAMRTFVDPIPCAKLRAIRALRRAGIATYALSNTNAIVTPRIVECFLRAEGGSAADYFDRMFLSYEMHLLKPDPAIFHRMTIQSGLKPARTFFIDDNGGNIDAARKLGFQVYMPSAEEDFTPLLYEIARQNEKRHE